MDNKMTVLNTMDLENVTGGLIMIDPTKLPIPSGRPDMVAPYYPERPICIF